MLGYVWAVTHPNPNNHCCWRHHWWRHQKDAQFGKILHLFEPFSSIFIHFLHLFESFEYRFPQHLIKLNGKGPQGPINCWVGGEPNQLPSSLHVKTSETCCGNDFEDMFEVSINANWSNCLPRVWRTPTWHKTLLPFHPISQWDDAPDVRSSWSGEDKAETSQTWPGTPWNTLISSSSNAII